MTLYPVNLTAMTLLLGEASDLPYFGFVVVVCFFFFFPILPPQPGLEPPLLQMRLSRNGYTLEATVVPDCAGCLGSAPVGLLLGLVLADQDYLGTVFVKESGVEEAWKGKLLLKIWPAKKYLVKWMVRTESTCCAIGIMDEGKRCEAACVGSAPA